MSSPISVNGQLHPSSLPCHDHGVTFDSSHSPLSSKPAANPVSSALKIYSESSYFSPSSLLPSWSRPPSPLPYWSPSCAHCFSYSLFPSSNRRNSFKMKSDHLTQSKSQSSYDDLQDTALCTLPPTSALTTSLLFTSFQPRGPFLLFHNMLGSLPFQDLCTCYYLYLECFSPSYPSPPSDACSTVSF